MTVYKCSDLLALPFVDLVEADISSFFGILRDEKLPDDEVLEALDAVLMAQVKQRLSQQLDLEALRYEVDQHRRLVPHRVRSELDQRRKPWATRWATLADLLDLAAQSLADRQPERARGIAHAQELLELIERRPGMSQVELKRDLGLKAANLSRILGVLEANGLIRRETRGRTKLVFATTAPQPAPGDVAAPLARRGMLYLVPDVDAA